MNTVILCVGKLKESWWRDAAEEYLKRLSRYGAIGVEECPDLPEPRGATDVQIARLLEAEGEAMLARLRPRDRIVALTIDGRRYDSPAFARRIAEWDGEGMARLVFLIGSSRGLSPAVLARASEKISFSPMTFPHQMARVMLLEQLYRGRKILSGETYHK